MPFVRFSRDKRGYQQLFLVESLPPRRGKPARSRVLYYYRTPPGVKVGREPFDEAVRRSLEERYPDIVFDWPRLASAQPPPDVEPWRERRRVERAVKQARAAEEREEAAAIDAGDEVDEPTPGLVEEQIAGAGEVAGPEPVETAAPATVGPANPDQIAEPVGPAAPVGTFASGTPAEGGGRRRRRRRRRRGRSAGAPGSAEPFAPNSTDVGSPPGESEADLEDDDSPADEPDDPSKDG